MFPSNQRFTTLLLFLLFSCLMACQKDGHRNVLISEYPMAHQDTSHYVNIDGKPYLDEYAWMEDMTDQVKSWMQLQNRLTTTYIDSISYHKSLTSRIEDVYTYDRIEKLKFIDNQLHFTASKSIESHPSLYQFDGKRYKKIFSTNQFNDIQNCPIVDYNYSENGDFLAVVVQENGTDWQRIMVLDMITNTIADVVYRAHSTTVAWHGNGFYYTTYEMPLENEPQPLAFQQVKYHAIGEPQGQDFLVVQERDNPRAKYEVLIPPSSDWLVLRCHDGFQEDKIYARPLTKGKDNFTHLTKSLDPAAWHPFGIDGDRLLCVSNYKSASQKIVGLDLNGKAALEERIDYLPNKVKKAVWTGGSYYLCLQKEDGDEIVQISAKGTESTIIVSQEIYNALDFVMDTEQYICYYNKSSILKPDMLSMVNLLESKTRSIKGTGHHNEFTTDSLIVNTVNYQDSSGLKKPLYFLYRKNAKIDGLQNTLIHLVDESEAIFKIHPEHLIFCEHFVTVIYLPVPSIGRFWDREEFDFAQHNILRAIDYLSSNKLIDLSKTAISAKGYNASRVADAFQNQDQLAGLVLKYFPSDIHYNENNAPYPLSPYRFDVPSPYFNIEKNSKSPMLLLSSDNNDESPLPNLLKYAAKLQAYQQNQQPILMDIEIENGNGSYLSVDRQLEESKKVIPFLFYCWGIHADYSAFYESQEI